MLPNRLAGIWQPLQDAAIRRSSDDQKWLLMRESFSITSLPIIGSWWDTEERDLFVLYCGGERLNNNSGSGNNNLPLSEAALAEFLANTSGGFLSAISDLPPNHLGLIRYESGVGMSVNRGYCGYFFVNIPTNDAQRKQNQNELTTWLTKQLSGRLKTGHEVPTLESCFNPLNLQLVGVK